MLIMDTTYYFLAKFLLFTLNVFLECVLLIFCVLFILDSLVQLEVVTCQEGDVLK